MFKPVRYFQLYLTYLGLKLSDLANRNANKSWFRRFHHCFKAKNGFEIGGPSSLFQRDILNVYQLAEQVDGCNFSDTTVWEGKIAGTAYAYYHDKTGTQYILEGTDLKGLPNNSYDFVLSSHSLEHIANPLKALFEWNRILKAAGALLLILPDKRFTFDRKRPVTSFDHLLSDLANNVGEDDLTHLPEILRLHDLSFDPGAGTDSAKFKARSEQNLSNRCLHHHVFDKALVEKMLTYSGFELLSDRFIPPFNNVFIGRKKSSS